MKRLILISLFIARATAQPSLTASHIRFGTTLPSTCNPSTGDVFFKTTATIGQYQCLTTNTWTAVPTTSGGATPGAPDNSLQYRVSSTTLGGSSISFLPSSIEVVGYYMNGDLNASGTYTDTAHPDAMFSVATDNLGTPDTFIWYKCSPTCGAASAETPMTTCPSMTALSDGISVCWTSNTGHEGDEGSNIYVTASVWPAFTQLSTTGFGGHVIYGNINTIYSIGESQSAWIQQLNGNAVPIWGFRRSRGDSKNFTDIIATDEVGNLDFTAYLESLDTPGFHTYESLASIHTTLDTVSPRASHLFIRSGAQDFKFASDATLALPPILFANLPSVNGKEGYCSDCTVTSGSDNTCAGSGTGAKFIRLNGVNKCWQ